VLSAAGIGCSSSGTGSGDGGAAGAPISVAVTPRTASIARGTSQQFQVTGTYSNGTTRTVTVEATWTSSAAGVATVGATTGRAAGVGVGMAVISATFQGKVATGNLTVTAAPLSSIAVTPSGASFAAGTRTQFTAMATFADGSKQDVTQQSTWTSDGEAVATVSEGLVSALVAGTATITAAMGGKMGSAPLTVTQGFLTSIDVTPSITTLARGTNAQFRATGRFSDGKTQDLTADVAWSATPAAVATVSDQGLASGLSGGMATISAVFQGQTGTAALTVTEARLVSIAITPANATVTRGATRQFTATGTFSAGSAQDLTAQVTWASDPIAIATISNAAGSRGLATGVATGRATIRALFQGIPGSTSLTVTAPGPSVTSVNPASGPASGGASVTITGTGLAGATAVRFGTAPARSFSVTSDTQISAVTPLGAGLTRLIVTTPIGTSNAVSYTFQPAPTLGGVDPQSGPQAGGTVVTLTGTGFTGATSVSFGTTAGTSVTVVSDTRITVVSPAGTGGVNIAVNGPNGPSGTVAFAYGLAPTVGGLVPTSGAQAGGTAVTITGTGLTGAAAVRFGPTPAVSFTVVSATQITAVSPPGIGSVNVAITTASGTSNGSLFTYRSAPEVGAVSPSAGPVGGGNTVLIVGAGFEGTTAVRFGGTPALFFSVVSDTLLTAVAPPGSGPQLITVTGPTGTSGGISYTYGPLPTLTALSPASGSVPGGLTITLTGTAFSVATSVLFDATSVSFAVLSDNAIALVTPPGSGSVNVKVVNLFGESNTMPFSYGPAPAISSLAPSSGPEFVGTNVTITGTSFTGATSVAFGATPAVSFTVVSDNQITAGVPAAIGVVLVTVTTPFATSNSASYTHLAAPTVTSFTPLSGPLPGGTSVAVTGTGFTGATAVAFGGTAATSFTVTSAGQIIAVTAAGTGLVPVVVTTPNGTGMSSSTFFFIPVPALTAVAPAVGPETSGNAVTISGTFLTGATAVTFGATPSPSFSVVNPTAITANVPAGTGTVLLTVTTPSGTSNTVSYAHVPAPSITSLSPTFGPEPGATIVIISGTALDALTAVNFGSASAPFTQISPTQVTATAPAGTGVVAVTVTNEFGTSSSQPYTYGPVPILTSLSRVSGSTAGGQTVTITGTALTGATSVTFGAAAAISFSVVSATQIDAVSPAGLGAQSLTVTTAYGTSNALTFTFGSPATVSEVNPATGAQAGGNVVTIAGSGFTGTTAVAFGVNPASTFTVNSASTITATTPAGGAGTIDVIITNAFGTSATGLTSRFTYGPVPVISALMPSTGSTAGSSTMITGTALDGATAVAFGAIAGSIVGLPSPTGLMVLAPEASAGAVQVTITTPFGTSAGVTYTYGPPPTITGLTPSSGPEAGLNSVVIAGTGMAAVTSVSFGTAAAVFNHDSDTQLTATVPAGTGAVVLAISGAFGSSTTEYAYLPAPTIAMLSPSTGPLAGGTTVVITGTNLSGTTGVKFGAASATGLMLISATEISVVSPAGTNATLVQVTSVGGASNTLTFTYVPPPTVSSVTPNAGPTAGGTTVTIVGTDLSTVTSVTFAGATGTALMAVSNTTLTVVTPAGTGSFISVVVVTAGGMVTVPEGYSYVAPPAIGTVSPGFGSALGSTSVTITGTNLTLARSVTIGGTAATINTNTASTIGVTTAAHGAGAVNVVVTTDGGPATKVNGFTYETTPTIGMISPSSGSSLGGDSVTITGTGFLATTGVTFGGGAGSSVTVVTDTTITVVTPAYVSSGAVNVVVTSTLGSATTVAGFTYTAVCAFPGAPCLTNAECCSATCSFVQGCFGSCM
jgi:hypothetical protein